MTAQSSDSRSCAVIDRTYKEKKSSEFYGTYYHSGDLPAAERKTNAKGDFH